MFNILRQLLKRRREGADRLSWSADRGPRERNLFRRDGNPLFPADRRVITPQQVADAQAADAAEMVSLHARTTELVGVIVEGPDVVEMDAVKSLVDDADGLRASCLGQGTQSALGLAATLDQVAASLLTAIRGSRHSAEFLSAFEKWMTVRAPANRMTFDPAWLEIQRLDPTDVIPTICSMEPAAIERVMQWLPDDVREHTRNSCMTTLLVPLISNELGPEVVRARLRALGVSDL